MMWELAERAYFLACVGLGRLLRAGRYSKTRIVRRDGKPEVHKRRFFYAPFLVWLGGPLLRMLDTGVQVLPQRKWEARERLIYHRPHGPSIRIDAGRTLVLPWLDGKPLATLLKDRKLEEPVRKRAVELAVLALAKFHTTGFTHGDAMAENVLVDLEGGVAHWIDFETIHDASRPMAWRRADDVRALLATCLLRTARGNLADTLQLILDVYQDEGVTRFVASSFDSVWRRPLSFHLGQAALSYRRFRVIGRLLSGRLGESGSWMDRRYGSR